MWDYKPWDNDGAADWYGDLMENTKLRDIWLEGIKEDPIDSPDVVRAAAGLFIMLGRVYIWPIDNYDNDLELTISQLGKVAENEEYKEVPELIEIISEELNELESRLKKDSPDSTPSAKPWWKLW
jgi:hypothetical protein